MIFNTNIGGASSMRFAQIQMDLDIIFDSKSYRPTDPGRDTIYIETSYPQNYKNITFVQGENLPASPTYNDLVIQLPEIHDPWTIPATVNSRNVTVTMDVPTKALVYTGSTWKTQTAYVYVLSEKKWKTIG